MWKGSPSSKRRCEHYSLSFIQVLLVNISETLSLQRVCPRPSTSRLSVCFNADFVNQLYKPGADPETMLMAMEWVGALLQRYDIEY